MNAERLRAAIDLLLDIEKKANFQGLLENLAASVTTLSSANSPENQRSVASQLEKAEAIAKATFEKLNPAERGSISDIKADLYFNQSLVADIKEKLVQNAMTPTVALSDIQSRIEERKSFLNVLRSTRSGLRNLGIEPVDLQPGQADISVLLPRSLFHNDLDGLQKELKTLNSVIRTFYEISNVTPSAIQVKEISTSDPTFFLGIDVAPLIAMALAIKWCIDVIKGSHDIKKIAENARKADIPDEVVKQLEKTIHDKVEVHLQQKMQEMFENFTGGETRKNELEKPLRFALEQLLHRIERGMIIEIHSSPPEIDPANEGQAATKLQSDFRKLDELAKSISYPQIEGDPVLQLTTGDVTIGSETGDDPPVHQ